jgi:hypothetical protein
VLVVASRDDELPCAHISANLNPAMGFTVDDADGENLV